MRSLWSRWGGQRRQRHCSSSNSSSSSPNRRVNRGEGIAHIVVWWGSGALAQEAHPDAAERCMSMCGHSPREFMLGTCQAEH